MTDALNNTTTDVTECLQALHQSLVDTHPAPLEHAQAMGKFFGEWASRACSNGVKTAAVFPLGLHADTLNELYSMNQAVLQRLQQQQKQWLTGCAGLVRDYAQLKHANTLSKLVSQQCNLVAQFGQLLNSQASAMMLLQENIEVDYGYWVSQKLS